MDVVVNALKTAGVFRINVYGEEDTRLKLKLLMSRAGRLAI